MTRVTWLVNLLSSITFASYLFCECFRKLTLSGFRLLTLLKLPIFNSFMESWHLFLCWDLPWSPWSPLWSRWESPWSRIGSPWSLEIYHGSRVGNLEQNIKYRYSGHDWRRVGILRFVKFCSKIVITVLEDSSDYMMESDWASQFGMASSRDRFLQLHG